MRHIPKEPTHEEDHVETMVSRTSSPLKVASDRAEIGVVVAMGRCFIAAAAAG